MRRLQALQINLPEVPPAGGSMATSRRFVPFVRTGNLIYLSGRLAKKDGKPFLRSGGKKITSAEGQAGSA